MDGQLLNDSPTTVPAPLLKAQDLMGRTFLISRSILESVGPKADHTSFPVVSER